MDKALGLLGIAKKAGLLAIGSEQTAISARHGKAHLIISANDTSDGSIRRAKANAETNETKYLAVPYSKHELGTITGRGSPGILAILDKGLAENFERRVMHNEYTV
ncbi:MAG: ribosomal L7Ae/L30e/S12e/Gadd45 family protein [Oscillospiraceae bacterium]|nr:ribosomal L7Ae/L30e/S12e/Gadd45 family protein [Oscillospiraceae bacterium]